MKRESLVYMISGTVFGVLVGWIIGSQQARPAAPGLPSAPSAATAAPSSDAPPPLDALLKREKFDALLDAIDNADEAMVGKPGHGTIPAEVAAFLRMAAHRHVVFDYHAIAEFYCHAAPVVQRLMEASALVIIDFDDAIEHGYVSLSDALAGIYSDTEDGDEQQGASDAQG